MIRIESNADVFCAQLDALLAETEQAVDFGYWSWTMRVFADLAESTPQWSGDLAANWYYSLNSPSGAYSEILAKKEHWGAKGFTMASPLQRGDPFAVTASVHRAMEGPKPTYTDVVYFSNNTPIGFDVENQLIPLRPVNLVDGRVAMADFMAVKWREMPYDARDFTFD